MRVMVVDDEPLARQRLARMLASIAGVELVAEAENGAQALMLYRQHRPELLLLDIEMPGMNGIELARQLAAERPPPAVIFCTAYDQHALAAFDARAVAYLLKPVAASRLQEALQVVTQLNQAQLSGLDDGAHSGDGHVGATLMSRSCRGVERLPIEKVAYFIADNKYVSAVYDDGELILDDALKDLEETFGDVLQRVHRNALVVWSKVRGMRRTGAGRYRVLLEGVDNGPLISRRHLSAFKARLAQAEGKA
jgi:two-component system, LytTR family, response regulator AlgR